MLEPRKVRLSAIDAGGSLAEQIHSAAAGDVFLQKTRGVCIQRVHGGNHNAVVA